MLNSHKRYGNLVAYSALKAPGTDFLRDQLDVRSNPPTEVCIYLGHWWFWGPVALAMILLGSKLFLELSRLNDRTNLASEVSSAAYTWLVGAGESQVLTYPH